MAAAETAAENAVTPIRRALISVSDKTGVEAFARALNAAGVEILSTGGTAKALAAAGVPVTDVAAVTGWPEMMDARVKTLHPAIHAGLLARRDHPGDLAAMTEHGIGPIDCLVVNLYPFETTVAAGASADAVIENIDVGGPAMIRAAAKNARWVTVVTDPADYDAVAATLPRGAPARLRSRLAAKAFARTADYDAAIADWWRLHTRRDADSEADPDPSLPAVFTIRGRLRERLRYGENPHQPAALYLTGEPGFSVATARQVGGKPLSYNNLSDADAAFALVCDLDPRRPAVAIVKHANPCGVAVGLTLCQAYENALRCDPRSAYGGIVAVNGALDAETASAIASIFTEVVVAPDAEADALKILNDKPNLRVLLTGGLVGHGGLDVRSVGGGFLVQARDAGRIDTGDLRIVTARQPSAAEMADMLFAFQVAKHVKSNAIVYARDGATVGIGAGQMSRVDSVRIAARKAADAAAETGEAQPLTHGSVLASDAFFPFADGLLAAVDAGATAVIQPGGSLRDGEIVEAADRHGIAMAFTGLRHFRH